MGKRLLRGVPRWALHKSGGARRGGGEEVLRSKNGGAHEGTSGPGPAPSGREHWGEWGESIGGEKARGAPWGYGREWERPLGSWDGMGGDVGLWGGMGEPLRLWGAMGETSGVIGGNGRDRWGKGEDLWGQWG